MVVDEGYRGRGAGSALIAEAERWFRLAGCVKLEVTSGNGADQMHTVLTNSMAFCETGSDWAGKLCSTKRRI